jgi:uncharacterized membrane protein (DUF2068 family)
MHKKLKVIACLKILRGTIAIAIGVSLLQVHLHLQFNSWKDHPNLKNLALNDPFFQLLTSYFSKLTQEQIVSVSILAICLGALRWLEAYGIWLNKNWACYLAVVTGFIYVPFEINELLNQFSWIIFTILIINIIVVLYLIHILQWNKRVAHLQ